MKGFGICKVSGTQEMLSKSDFFIPPPPSCWRSPNAPASLGTARSCCSKDMRWFHKVKSTPVAERSWDFFLSCLLLRNLRQGVICSKTPNNLGHIKDKDNFLDPVSGSRDLNISTKERGGRILEKILI